jgi:hypothetical protein
LRNPSMGQVQLDQRHPQHSNTLICLDKYKPVISMQSSDEEFV